MRQRANRIEPPDRAAALILCSDVFSLREPGPPRIKCGAGFRSKRLGCYLPQQRTDDEPVKWQDDREINPAKQIVRQHQRGGGDTLAMAESCDIHHDTKIQVLVV
jgi:hypothetical protein